MSLKLLSLNPARNALSLVYITISSCRDDTHYMYTNPPLTPKS